MIDDLKKQYKVVKKELISSYTEGYIGKNTYKVTLANGREFKIEQILKNKRNGDAVVIIPITTDNKYVLIIEARPNVKEEVVLSFPAGMIDEGEEAVDAAKRELEEETGYIAKELIELEEHYQDQGCSSAIIKTYLAVGCEKKSKTHLDENENLTSVLVTDEELDDMYNNGEIKSANGKIAYITYKMKKGR